MLLKIHNETTDKTVQLEVTGCVNLVSGFAIQYETATAILEAEKGIDWSVGNETRSGKYTHEVLGKIDEQRSWQKAGDDKPNICLKVIVEKNGRYNEGDALDITWIHE